MKATEFPTKIKILDQTYDVTYYQNLAEVDKNKKDSLCGQIDFENHNIRVYKQENYSKGDIWNTLIHEIFHALVDKMVIRCIKNLKEVDEEDTIQQLTVGINTVFHDNKFNFEDCEENRSLYINDEGQEEYVPTKYWEQKDPVSIPIKPDNNQARRDARTAIKLLKEVREFLDDMIEEVGVVRTIDIFIEEMEKEGISFTKDNGRRY